jgi:hypothetical protein
MGWRYEDVDRLPHAVYRVLVAMLNKEADGADRETRG